MSEEITASMIFDVPSLLPGLRWHSRTLNRLLMVPIVICSVMAVFGILSIFAGPASLPDPQPPKLLTLLGPLMPLVLMLSLRWVIRFSFAKAIRSSPSAGKAISYHFNDTGVKIALADSKAEHGWSAFLKSLITPDGVLLYQQKQMFNWVAKTAFSTEADYARFLELLKAKTKYSQVG